MLNKRLSMIEKMHDDILITTLSWLDFRNIPEVARTSKTLSHFARHKTFEVYDLPYDTNIPQDLSIQSWIKNFPIQYLTLLLTGSTNPSDMKTPITLREDKLKSPKAVQLMAYLGMSPNHILALKQQVQLGLNPNIFKIYETKTQTMAILSNGKIIAWGNQNFGTQELSISIQAFADCNY